MAQNEQTNLLVNPELSSNRSRREEKRQFQIALNASTSDQVKISNVFGYLQANLAFHSLSNILCVLFVSDFYNFGQLNFFK